MTVETEPQVVKHRPPKGAAVAAGTPRAARWRVGWDLLAVLSLLLASGWACQESLASVATLVTRAWPLTSWEGAYVLEAAAIAAGEPIYHPPGDAATGEGVVGPAAVMYGPISPYLLGFLQTVTPPSLLTGRLLTLSAAGGLVALAWTAIGTPSRRNPVAVFVTAALVISLHYRARAFFTEVRPDVTALFVASLGLFIAYRAHESRRMTSYLAAAVVITLAFLLKQTAACYAVIPAVAVTIGGFVGGRWREARRSFVAELAWASSPCVAVVLTVLVIRTGFGSVYHYAFAMPSLWPMRWDRLPYMAASGLTLFPLFVVTLGVWLAGGTARPRRAEAVWLLTAGGIGWAAGTLFFVKRGGSYNSLLWAWWPMTVFAAIVIGSILCGESTLRRGTRLGLLGLILPLSLLASLYGLSDAAKFARGEPWHGGPGYANAVDLAGRLGGGVASRVVCPEDPTIPFFATGFRGRTMDVEYDAVQRAFMPEALRREIDDAAWVIDVDTPYTGRMTPRDLWRMGFDRIDAPALRGTPYTLWHRDPGTPRAARRRLMAAGGVQGEPWDAMTRVLRRSDFAAEPSVQADQGGHRIE